jgi:hypothetical protein
MPAGKILRTKAVVAIWVLLTVTAAVGAVGTPVNAGEASVAIPRAVTVVPRSLLDVSWFPSAVIERPTTTFTPLQLMYECDVAGQSKAVPEAVLTCTIFADGFITV